MARVETEAAERRAWREALRSVARLLRLSGLALMLIGGAGLVLAEPGAWWRGPSWFSLAIGAALVLAGIVQRVRQRRERTDSVSES